MCEMLLGRVGEAVAASAVVLLIYGIGLLMGYRMGYTKREIDDIKKVTERHE